MQIIYFDQNKKELKVRVEDKDDLWQLSHLIDAGDLVSSRTLRKIKIDSKIQDSSAFKRIPITLQIQVQKVDFAKNIGSLRILGTITQERQDIPKGSHHSLSIEPDTTLTIIKSYWSAYHLSLVQESKKQKAKEILILAFDRQEAIFALTKNYGYEVLLELQGESQKKLYNQKEKSDFYQTLINILTEYDKKLNTPHIIVASPSFFKEDLLELIKKSKKELSKKIVLATCNSATKNAILEIFKRDEIKTIIKQTRIATEQELVEETLKEISKNGLVTYGYNFVLFASNLNAIKVLLITDNKISDCRHNKKYKELDDMLKKVHNQNGAVHIISSENEPGQKLDSIGGIAAILRYKITF